MKQKSAGYVPRRYALPILDFCSPKTIFKNPFNGDILHYQNILTIFNDFLFHVLFTTSWRRKTLRFMITEMSKIPKRVVDAPKEKLP